MRKNKATTGIRIEVITTVNKEVREGLSDKIIFKEMEIE